MLKSIRSAARIALFLATLGAGSAMAAPILWPVPDPGPGGGGGCGGDVCCQCKADAYATYRECLNTCRWIPIGSGRALCNYVCSNNLSQDLINCQTDVCP